MRKLIVTLTLLSLFILGAAVNSFAADYYYITPSPYLERHHVYVQPDTSVNFVEQNAYRNRYYYTVPSSGVNEYYYVEPERDVHYYYHDNDDDHHFIKFELF